MNDKEIEIEVEGKTTSEAVKKALKQLKVKRADVTIDVVCEEEKGLFGMQGAKMAKVKVSLIKKQY
jgi:spoIIIJ-associated protein